MKKCEPYSIFAHYYDTIMGDAARLQAEALLAQAGKRKTMCDYGCGIGILLQTFICNGVFVYGCELSPHMHRLAVERTGISEPKRLSLADMTTYRPPKPVEFACCNADSINHLLKANEWCSFFSNVHAGLQDDGLFVFDYISVYDMENYWPGCRTTYETDEFMCARLANYNPSTKIALEEDHWFLYHEDSWQHLVECHQQRSFPLLQVEEWLRDAGFRRFTAKDAETGNTVHTRTIRIKVTAVK